MADQWPAPDFIDGNMATAQPCSLPVLSSPIPGSSVEYLLTQDFMQLRKNVSAAAIGTAHPSSGKTPDYSSFVLVSEGPKQDQGNGVCRWTRTYAALPASHDEWESYVYNFVGSSPVGPLSSAYVGRYRFSKRVTCRVQHDYYIVMAGTPTDYLKNSAGDIPIIRSFDYVQQYLVTSTQYGSWYQKSDYLSDSALAGVNVGTLLPTVPTETQYASMMKDAASNGWNAGTAHQILTTDAPPLVNLSGAQTYNTTQTAFTKRNFPAVTSFYGQLVAEDSILSRWQGNIYLRQTRLVLAI
jgi:hypothetical protein